MVIDFTRIGCALIYTLVGYWIWYRAEPDPHERKAAAFCAIAWPVIYVVLSAILLFWLVVEGPLRIFDALTGHLWPTHDEDGTPIEWVDGEEEGEDE